MPLEEKEKVKQEEQREEEEEKGERCFAEANTWCFQVKQGPLWTLTRQTPSVEDKASLGFSSHWRLLQRQEPLAFLFSIIHI